MSTPPKRDARAVLFTGGLLLVPLAALWLLLDPAHSFRHAGGSAPRPGAGGASDGGTGDGGSPAHGDAPADPGTPPLPVPRSWPPPRVASGAPTQAEWTLLALTLATGSGIQTPPAPLAPPVGVREPDDVARNPFVQTSTGAVGLWIGVRGGVGIKTLTIPQDGRHSYPFGGFSLVSMPQPPIGGGVSGGTTVPGSTTVSGRFSRITLGWERTGTPPLGSERTGLSSPLDQSGQAPYRVIGTSPSVKRGPAGRPDALAVTLTPTPFSARFRVTALPLSADGRPTGKAVSLLCQPVTATALFAQIPADYSAATRQFRVTVSRAGGKPAGSASWLVTGLPPVAEDALPKADADGQDPTPAVSAAARVGPFALRAVAAEAEDTGGRSDESNPSPPWNGRPSPENLDQHLRTGLPTLHFLLLARAAAPAPPGQTWLFQLDRVSPQWSALAPPRGPSLVGISGMAGAGVGGSATLDRSGTAGRPRPLGVYPLSRFLFKPDPAKPDPSKPDPAEWLLQDGAVGAAWPGQQKWVTLAGTVIRQATRTETVTFHDAEVVHDAGFGGDRIVWHHPETETTPSGIAVTVLNGQPGRRETTGLAAFGAGYQGPDRDWWYDRGNAELLLAWRLPRGFVPGAHADLNAPRVAFPGRGAVTGRGFVMGAGQPPPAGALSVSWDDTRPDPYIGAVAPPGGARDARTLAQAGYTPLRLSVWAAQTPKRTLAPGMFQRATAFPVPGPFPPSGPFPARRTAAPAALPPYSWRDGPFVVTASPLPRHLATITFRITIREEQARLPVVLRAPVAATLPPGADPRPVPHRATPLPAPLPPPVLVSPLPSGRDTGRHIGKPAIAQM